MSEQVTTPVAARPSPDLGTKFVYSSGARPLDGYTLRRGIGGGGFGEVYYATSDAGKEVALKLIRRNLDIELRGVTQCLNLKHPNLVALFDIRTDAQGDRWVVMEYAGGESLETLLDRHPRGLPAPEAIAWFRGLAAGVAYLHDHGIVHRDLKPGNLFCDDGVIKIGDYGLSKFISCSRRSGHTDSVGTVHYMAPEIANGRYGKEIDIYALGVILHEMLTGRVPFEGESVGEVLMKHLTSKPDLSALAEPFRTIVDRALTKDPAARIASVGEMLALLPGGASGANYPVRAEGNPPPYLNVRGAPYATRPNGAQPAIAQFPIAQLAPSAVAPSPLRNEPLLRAVLQRWNNFLLWWTNGQPTLGEKILVGLAGVVMIVVLVNLLPIAVVGVAIYAVYAVVRLMILPPTPPPVAKLAETLPRAPQTAMYVAESVAPKAAAVVPVAVPAKSRRRALADILARRSPRERFTTLLGSLLLAAVSVLAITVMCTILRGASSNQQLSVSRFAWVMLVSLAGAWGIMIVSAFWSGKGDSTLRRLTMMIVGLGVGLFAWWLHEFLLVRLPYDNQLANITDINIDLLNPASRLSLLQCFDSAGVPQLTAFLSHFAFLFLVPRWWVNADPLRRHRVRVGAVIAAVLWTFVVTIIWPFPQPWTVVVAGTMALAIQLASPWPLGRREEQEHDRLRQYPTEAR